MHSKGENVDKTRKKRMKKNSKVKCFFKFSLLFIVIVIICFGGYSYYCLYNMSKSDSASKKDEVKNVKPAKKGESVNFLIVGIDIGTPGSSNPNDPKRTDTMMLMHYNPQDKRADIVSIPRDTWIEIKNCNIKKINGANAVGGIDYAIDRVENLLDIKVNHYVKVDYKGFREIIDAIGGIDMYITRNMDYDAPDQDLHIHFKKGTTAHLDGEKAEKFFRWRQNNDGSGFATGDIGRIGNQHIFIEKVIEKVKSPSIVFKIKDILSAVSKNVETDLQPSEIIKYGLNISSINQENIKLYTLKGHDKKINEISYFIYDPIKSREIIDAINDIKPMSVDRSEIKIKVLNCTNKSGLAANYGEYLKKKGYTNFEIGNGEIEQNTKVIINTKFDNDVIDNIKNEFKIDNLKKDSSDKDDCDIVIFLGGDYDYIE